MNQEHKILISNHIDNEVTADEKSQAEHLINSNAEYKKYYEELIEVNKILDQEQEVTLKQSLIDSIKHKIYSETQKARKLRVLFNRTLKLAVAASLLLVVTFFAYLIITDVSTKDDSSNNIVTTVHQNDEFAEIDTEMLKYLDVLMSGVNYDAILAFNDEYFEVLENSYELGLLEDAVMTNIINDNNNNNED